MQVTSSDKIFLAPLVALPLVLAIVGYALGTDHGFGPGTKNFGINPQAWPLLVVLILGPSFMGLSAPAQELVKERLIYDRELSVGLGASTYIDVKLLVLGGLVSAQTTGFVLITLASGEVPDSVVVPASSVTECSGYPRANRPRFRSSFPITGGHLWWFLRALLSP